MGIYLTHPRRDKTFEQASMPGISVTSVEMQGWRTFMEDAKLIYLSPDESFPSFFAVFDGHGGL
jgi:protein phosphatase 1G